MKTYEVKCIEVIAPGSSMETTVTVSAATQEEAIEKARPPYPSKYGRTFVVKVK